MAFTLALDENWDIYTDGAGQIATVETDGAIAQNVANAVRLFTDDAFLNRTQGVPHFVTDISKRPNPPLAVSLMTRAAKSVDGVEKATVSLGAMRNRVQPGDIAIRTNTGTKVTTTWRKS